MGNNSYYGAMGNHSYHGAMGNHEVMKSNKDQKMHLSAHLGQIKNKVTSSLLELLVAAKNK